MAHNIDTAKGRSALQPRKSAYYGRKLAAGLHLGIRRLPPTSSGKDGGGSWVARFRPPHGVMVWETFGPVAGLGTANGLSLEDATAAALAWHQDCKDGTPKTSAQLTLAGLCELRNQHLISTGKVKQAAEWMKRLRVVLLGRPAINAKLTAILPHKLARKPVAAITELDLEQWRHGMRKADGSAYASGTIDLAVADIATALNFGVRKRYISAARAVEWKSGALKKARDGVRRELYLDAAERRRLVAAAYQVTEAFGMLVEAAAHTGARPGELRAAIVRDFDARLGIIKLTGKTGTRTVKLTPAATAHFARCAKGKLPMAPLLLRECGLPWHASRWQSDMAQARVIAKLPAETCMYTLRHSFITQLLIGQQVGGDYLRFSTLTVSIIVGTSLQMIEEHYGHIASAEFDALRNFALL